jgi:hypothetical protein
MDEAEREAKKEEIENEMIRLVKKLGGGWGWDKGVAPYIKFTLPEVQAIEARLPREEFEDATDELYFNLVQAERYATQALEVLYRLKDPAKRSIFFRMAVGRAQNILMSVLVRDVKIERRKL